MFRSVSMMHLSAIILKRDERSVLEFLGEVGAVQLIQTAAGPETAPIAPNDVSTENDRYSRILADVEELRHDLEIVKGLDEVHIENISIDEAEEKLGDIRDQIRQPLELRRHLMHQRNQLSVVCDQVSDFDGYNMPLDGCDSFSFLHFVTGSIPAEKMDSFRGSCGANTVLIPAMQEKGRQSIIVLASRKNKTGLDSALQKAEFQHHPLPIACGKTVDMLHEEKQRERDRVDKDIDKVVTQLKAFGIKFAHTIDQIAASARNETLLLAAQTALPRTESTILISGWLPADASEEIRKGLAKITREKYILEMTPPENSDEPIPVLLRHSRILRPFGTLVSAYGLPNYHEMEPTIFVALSYVIMFGIMFGDIGHGVVLCLLGLGAFFFARKESFRDAGVLLLAGGISSIIFGSVYGSFFGLEQFKKYALWHDPLEGNPIKLMYGSIGFGITIMSIGIILNVINRLRRGDRLGAFLDKFGLTGLLFYWGALALLTQGTAIRSRGFMLPAIILLIGLPVLGWILKEPLEYLHHSTQHNQKTSAGKMITAILESFIEAFEGLLSYLANTISFVRLAAYAMSHAALLVAAFMVAEEVRHFSFGGTIFSISVIILGNLIAIVLEGVIASVQALRLEYYEFFGKFFSGDGKPFEPFRLYHRQR